MTQPTDRQAALAAAYLAHERAQVGCPDCNIWTTPEAQGCDSYKDMACPNCGSDAIPKSWVDPRTGEFLGPKAAPDPKPPKQTAKAKPHPGTSAALRARKQQAAKAKRQAKSKGAQR